MGRSVDEMPDGGEGGEQRAAHARSAPAEASGPPVSIRRLHVDEVAPHPYNPQHRHTDTAKVAALVADVARNGVLQPVVVASREAVVARDASIKERVPDTARWVLLAGHRRWAASREAGCATLPAILRDDLADPVGVIETFLRENLGRQEITVLEEAERYAWMRQREPTLSQRALAARVGVTQGQVSKRLKLLELPTSARHALDTGAISVKDAERILSLPSDDRAMVLRAVHEDGVDVDAAVARQRRVTRPASENRDRAQPPQRSAPAQPTGTEQCTLEPRDDDLPGRANRHRQEACRRLLADFSRLKTSVLQEILAEAVLLLPVEQAVLRHRELVEQLLGERVGGPRELTALMGNRRRTLRTALAAILAVLEAEAADRHYAGGRPWPPEVIRHVRRLVALGYHELSDFESAKLGVAGPTPKWNGHR